MEFRSAGSDPARRQFDSAEGPILKPISSAISIGAEGPIVTEKLARRGQHIAREYSVDLFELMRVSDVMDGDVPLIPATTPLPRFSARIASDDPLVCTRQGTLLGNENGELVGIITRGDVVRCFERSRDDT